MFQGDFPEGALVGFCFPSVDSDNIPASLAGGPAVAVYRNSDTAEATTGVTLIPDFDGRVGLNRVQIDTNSDNLFFNPGSEFNVVLTSGNVGGVSVVGRPVGQFAITRRSANFHEDGMGPGAVTNAFRAMGYARVDVVWFGDSEYLLNGHGYCRGFTNALLKRFPMFATHLGPGGPNGGNGDGQESNNGISIGIGAAIAGAPVGLTSWLDKGGGAIFPWDFFYGDVGAFSIGGIILSQVNALGCDGQLLWHVQYGTFADGGTHTIRFGVVSKPPDTVIYDSGNINVNTGTVSLKRSEILIPADPTRAGKEVDFHLNNFGIGGSTGIFVLNMRVSRPDRPFGFSMTAVDVRGGQPVRVVATDLKLMWAAGTKTLSNMFAEIRRLQGPVKRIIIAIECGQNGEIDAVMSVGPNPQMSNTVGGHLDNLDAIMGVMKAVWAYNGWPPDELFVALVPTHPLDNPGVGREVWLEQIRTAQFEWARRQPRAKVLDCSRRTNYQYLLNNGLYLPLVPGPGYDTAHMAAAGYDYLGELDLLEALDGSLDETGFTPADYVLVDPTNKVDPTALLHASDYNTTQGNLTQLLVSNQADVISAVDNVNTAVNSIQKVQTQVFVNDTQAS